MYIWYLIPDSGALHIDKKVIDQKISVAPVVTMFFCFVLREFGRTRTGHGFCTLISTMQWILTLFYFSSCAFESFVIYIEIY